MFVLGQESYGIPVTKVREVICMLDVTPVLQMPPYIRGVVNLRNTVIPVVDLRAKFGLTNIETTDSTCIIVVKISPQNGENMQIGLIVDAVEEVVNISPDDVDEISVSSEVACAGCVLGRVKSKGVVRTVLDIDGFVSDQFIEKITEAVKKV